MLRQAQELGTVTQFMAEEGEIQRTGRSVVLKLGAMAMLEEGVQGGRGKNRCDWRSLGHVLAWPLCRGQVLGACHGAAGWGAERQMTSNNIRSWYSRQ